jgi:hypothetical protein
LHKHLNSQRWLNNTKIFFCKEALLFAYMTTAPV